MMTNKCPRMIAYRWFTTDAYQTCCFQFKIHPFSLVDTENSFPFENDRDFVLPYWPRLATVLRARKTFSVSSWKVHFPLWYCTLFMMLFISLVLSALLLSFPLLGKLTRLFFLFRVHVEVTSSSAMNSSLPTAKQETLMSQSSPMSSGRNAADSG